MPKRKDTFLTSGSMFSLLQFVMAKMIGSVTAHSDKHIQIHQSNKFAE